MPPISSEIRRNTADPPPPPPPPQPQLVWSKPAQPDPIQPNPARPHLGEALLALFRRPFTSLVAGFNWKTAAISAMLRAIMFFFTNLRAGHNLALKATLVEGCYAIFTMGIFGAATERIRHARPAWLTGLVIWFGIPATLLTIQYNVHHFFGTPELRRSMIASFCFAALGTGFNWFAMRRGAFLVGDPMVGGPHTANRQSFLADLRALPLLIWDFISSGPKALLRR